MNSVAVKLITVASRVYLAYCILTAYRVYLWFCTSKPRLSCICLDFLAAINRKYECWGHYLGDDIPGAVPYKEFHDAYMVQTPRVSETVQEWAERMRAWLVVRDAHSVPVGPVEGRRVGVTPPSTLPDEGRRITKTRNSLKNLF